MGIRPEAFAEFSQRAANLQKALALSPGMQSFIEESQKRHEQLQKILNPHLAQIVKACEIITAQFKKAVHKVKDFFKSKIVKYLTIALPLWQMPRAQIEPSSGKSLQLPNSYRSHSPPFFCVIK
jgi:hypothetical protein